MHNSKKKRELKLHGNDNRWKWCTVAATMKHKVSTTFQIVFDASLKVKRNDGPFFRHQHEFPLSPSPHNGTGEMFYCWRFFVDVVRFLTELMLFGPMGFLAYNQPVKAHKKQPSNISKISHQHSVLWWYYLKVWFHADDKNSFLFKAICQASSVAVVDVARKIKLKWYLCYVPFFLDSLFHLIADFSLSSRFYNIFIEFNTQCHFKELFI